MDRWCSQGDVIDQAPEFQSDSILGAIPSERFDRHIEEGTLTTKQLLQGSYQLVLFSASQPQCVNLITAIVTAIVMLKAYQQGETAFHIERLVEKLAMWIDRIDNGTLFYDDGTKIPFTGGVSNHLSPDPSELVEVYKNGPRLGLPDFVQAQLDNQRFA